jgi:hypothetical protein
VTATLNPGLSCDNANNKISVKTTLDNCSATAPGPFWDDWAAGKIGGKITSANAATVANAAISVKAVTFGSCNFAGVGNSYTAAGAGKLTLLAADGVTKVKGGGGQFFAIVGGDLSTQSASLSGVMTKGFGAGAKIQTLIGLDLANPANANVLACNLGSVCPPPITPSTSLALITDANSVTRVDIQNNADCTANNAPFPCCTGAGTGNC